MSDSEQHSSKPCQACASQRGSEQAGIGMQGGHLAVDMLMAKLHLGNDSVAFLLNALYMGIESSEAISYVPNIFSCITGNFFHYFLFFSFSRTSCLLKMSGFSALSELALIL